MRVLITGASGFIGSHLVEALHQQHEIIACARNPHALRKRFPDIATAVVDLTVPRSIAEWLPLLKNVDAVVNAVGIIRESGRNTFDQLHHRAPCTLFQACQAAGVRKVIQISALGSDETARTRFHLSKKAADDCLKQLDLDWIILRPSLVYGPGGKSAALFKALAALPWIPLVDGGEQTVQPIYVGDLAAAVGDLLAPDTPSRLSPARISIDAVGPRPLSIRSMLVAYRFWLGKEAYRIFPIPFAVALPFGQLSEYFGASIVTGDTIRMLRRGNVGDVSTLTGATGVSPRSLASVLRKHPAEQADRWQAQLYFLRPLLRITLGLLWLFSGIVSLGIYPVERSYALLAEIGVTGPAAPAVLYAAALLDIALGIATLARYRIQRVGQLQIVLMIGYSLLISVGPGELWLHPFGPVTKNIPLIIATLVMMALERD
ncbi:MAG TPA: SDR family oxidoreductase [Gammaproteobacteria bacterium]